MADDPPADEGAEAGDDAPGEEGAASSGDESRGDRLRPGLSIEDAVGELEAVGGTDGEEDDEAASTDGTPAAPDDLLAALAGAAEGAAAVARAAAGGDGEAAADPSVPADVRQYDRFGKMDRASYERVNEFLRDRTYVTAREWAIARLCADFRTATGVEMTKIGRHLPDLVPFMTDTYSPQAVNQARSAFEGKVRKSGATFLYGAMSGFFTADELDDVMYEVTEVAKFLLEVEGVDLTVDEELAAEERISSVMREVRRASEELRHEGVECPECGHHIHAPGEEHGAEAGVE